MKKLLFTLALLVLSVQVGQAQPLDATGRIVIFAGESAGGAVDSVSAVQAAIEANGFSVLVVTELSSAAFVNPQTIWVMNGTFPENYALTEADGQFLVDRIGDGVPVYVEGADAFVFDPVTPFSEYDGVDRAASIDGDDTLAGLIGGNYLSAEFAGLSAAYQQDNATGNDYTDRLVPSTTDAAGSQAGVVWTEDGTGGSTAAYSTGVFYRTSGSLGNVLVQSWEFGGWGGSQAELAERYLDALDLGNQVFGRGDVNADSLQDIADTQELLSFLFVPSSGGLVCEDAADINDDGQLDVSDVVYMLNWLFLGGPPIPAPGCGFDPTDDDLNCLDWTPCLI